MTHKREDPKRLGLPQKPFLYTLDQIATLVSLDLTTLRRSYVHFDGRSVGARPAGKMLARNIAPATDKPEWRVAEQDLLRWLRYQGFRVHERGWIVS